MSLLNMISVVIGNFLFNGIYAATLSWYHGFVFFVGGLGYLVPTLFTA